MGCDASGQFIIGVPIQATDVFEVREVTYTCEQTKCPTVAGTIPGTLRGCALPPAA